MERRIEDAVFPMLTLPLVGPTARADEKLNRLCLHLCPSVHPAAAMTSFTSSDILWRPFRRSQSVSVAAAACRAEAGQIRRHGRWQGNSSSFPIATAPGSTETWGWVCFFRLKLICLRLSRVVLKLWFDDVTSGKGRLLGSMGSTGLSSSPTLRHFMDER